MLANSLDNLQNLYKFRTLNKSFRYTLARTLIRRRIQTNLKS